MALSKVVSYTSEFFAITAIAEALCIQVKTDVDAVVNGLLTIGGSILGAFLGGARHIVSGGLIGSSIAGAVSVSTKIMSLAEFLLNELPEGMRKVLVNICKAFLVPFQAIVESKQAIMKYAKSKMAEIRKQFIPLMIDFFNLYVKNASVMA